MAGPVLPDAAVLVPLLAEGAQALQPEPAALLVELAAREHGPRRRDRLELAARPLHDLGPEPAPAHPPLGAALEPQALPVPVMRDVVGPEGGVALLRPGLQPGHVVADELAAVLVVADEALVPIDVLVQPDGVEVVAPEIPEGLHDRLWV